MPPATAAHPMRFGRFQISPAERMLRVDGTPAALGARAFDLLLALAERRERLVGRQELLDLVWPGVVVEEHNITAQISSLRKLFGPGVIATVPGRGYQFVATPDAPTTEEQRPGGPAAPRHNLPEQRTRFIGRATALAELERLLVQSRLLTLSGIGGCGKTRLALEFARQRLAEFPDGVWFVDLAPLKESERVAAACAAALELGTDSDAPPVERVAAHLAERQALIVLDNCEQVRAGAAALADALLARPGRTRILATSREPLAVAGEQLYPVRSLSLPATAHLDEALAADAVRVFADRARLTLPEFEVDAANAAALVEICRQLDGIALAIELAAARVTMLSVFDIAARLEDRFRLLTGGSSAAARQQTLLATMQWSHDLLEPAEQRMLRQLAVFAGGCTLDAAIAVAQAADEYAALTLLTALHDKSLLVVDRGADGTRPRYRMLETVRQYAQQRLDEAGEADATRVRHVGHFLALAETAAPHLRGPQQIDWMARLREEQENLVAAITCCVQEPSPVDREWGPRLTAATGRYWVFNDIELGYRLTRAALQSDRGAADSKARWENLNGLATMCMHRGHGEEGATHAREALEVAQRLGVVEWQAMALNGLAACLDRSGNEEAALQLFQQARDLARASGNAMVLSYILNNVAGVEFSQGKLESAEQGYRQSLHLARGRGDILGTLITLHNLVRVLVAAGQHDDARVCASEAETLLRGMGDSVMRLELLEVVAGLASSLGEHDIAARFGGASRSRFSDAGYSRPSVDQLQLERLSANSRRALGDAAFERAEAAGRALDLDAAMRELREWLHCGA
ncbi:ATP-binding protein [Piscinibacter sp.]|uniref:ATP-binding protein n=1 Tax=Piscinibacter sp. TaxID=1903157 RepID=UPI002CEA75E4|nr:tetratricopeptide repeat protein [Albitalea sp.]HUG23507.1 tetratricopeptide repeat protein [Albitalea sp.]